MHLLRIQEVANLTGLSRSSIYKQIKLKNFPTGVKITDRSTAWPSNEVEAWIAARIDERPAPISDQKDTLRAGPAASCAAERES
jgi:prophage regulatory protein